MRVWEEGADFMTELKNDKDVMEVMNEAEIEDKFDLQYHTKHVDTIFSRVFNSEV
jgi:adenylosuccinate lyase